MSKLCSTSSDHLDSAAAGATAAPLSMSIWVNPAIKAQSIKYLGLYHTADNLDSFTLGQNSSAGTGEVETARNQNSPFAADLARTTSPLTTSAWHSIIGVYTSSVSSYLDGANKGTAGSTAVPVGVNNTVISGRLTDHSFPADAILAHGAVWSRALSDIEALYIGTGGNPRAVSIGLVNYWKIGGSESPVLDQIGSINLTVTGTSAGASEPNLQTHMTGGPVGNLSYAQGSAISSINVSGLFDNVSSPYTVTLQQQGAGTSLTTTSAAGSGTHVVVASATGFAAGDYLGVGVTGTPAKILKVSGTTLLVNVALPAWGSGASVFHYPVSPLTIAGLSISGGVFSGTPTSTGTQAGCFFRATCNGNSALVADSDVFSIAVNSAGGGGGSNGQLMMMGMGA